MDKFPWSTRVFQMTLVTFFIIEIGFFLVGKVAPWKQPVGSLFNSLVWGIFLTFLIVFFATSKLVKQNFQKLGAFRFGLNLLFATLLIGMVALAVYGSLPV